MTPIEIFAGIVLPSLIALTATMLFIIEARICINHIRCKPVRKKKHKDDEEDR